MVDRSETWRRASGKEVPRRGNRMPSLGSNLGLTEERPLLQQSLVLQAPRGLCLRPRGGLGRAGARARGKSTCLPGQPAPYACCLQADNQRTPSLRGHLSYWLPRANDVRCKGASLGQARGNVAPATSNPLHWLYPEPNPFMCANRTGGHTTVLYIEPCGCMGVHLRVVACAICK